MSHFYRDDGWPLCPSCGEDELWSSLQIRFIDEPNPTLEQYLAGPLSCYLCRWRGSVPPRSETRS